MPPLSISPYTILLLSLSGGIPSPMQLPSPLVLYCVLSSTHCLQSSCTLLAGVQPSPFVLCIVYIYHLQLVLLLLSTILFATFVPALTLFKPSLQVLSFVLTIDCTAVLLLINCAMHFFLVVNFSSSLLNLFL